MAAAGSNWYTSQTATRARTGTRTGHTTAGPALPPLALTVAQAGAATLEQDPGATEEGLRCARPADLGEVSQNLLT